MREVSLLGGHPRPEPLPPGARQALDVLFSEASLGYLERDIPSKLRLILESRRAYLLALLSPATVAEAGKVLFAVEIAMYGRAAASDAEAAYSTQLRAEIICDEPAWAIAAAAWAFLRGVVGDGHWRPTAGDIRADAEKRANPWRDELSRIQKVLYAPTKLAAGPRRAPQAVRDLQRALTHRDDAPLDARNCEPEERPAIEEHYERKLAELLSRPLFPQAEGRL